LHPTWFPPFNTAILNGFNFLFKDKKRLGSWTEYLKIRETLIETNNKHKSELSNDLGAIAGLCFEIGTQKMLIGNDEYLSEEERNKFEKNILKRQKEIQEEKLAENLHNEMQYHLLKIGVSLGFDVTPASNDKSKSFGGQSFSFISLTKFPELPTDKDTQNTIKLIDVLWFQKGTDKIIGAFEVEKSTSIYSGILRLSDLYFSISNGEEVFYIIIPDSREKDVIQQLNRPVIKNSKMNIKYILFSELRANCDAICKFGTDHSIMERISKSI
jgi:type II restriction enzyme